MALTKEQQEIRKHTIGASEVAAVVGESPWESPLDVYIRKVEGVEKEETEAMRRGNAFEPVIAELYEQEHLAEGEELVDPHHTTIHPTIEWASATPDRDVIRPKPHGVAHEINIVRLVELKRTNWRLAYRWQDGKAPQENILQAAWQMGVCDVDRCDLFALIGGDELALVPLERDRELEAMLFEMVEDFVLNHWRKGIPPDPDKSEAAKAALVKLYPKHLTDTLLPAAEPISEAAGRLARFKWLAKHVETAVTGEENIIKAYVGDAAGVEGEGWRCTWKASKDLDKVDWKGAFMSVCHGEGRSEDWVEGIINDFTTTTPGSRRFLFRPHKAWDAQLNYGEALQLLEASDTGKEMDDGV